MEKEKGIETMTANRTEPITGDLAGEQGATRRLADAAVWLHGWLNESVVSRWAYQKVIPSACRENFEQCVKEYGSPQNVRDGDIARQEKIIEMRGRLSVTPASRQMLNLYRALLRDAEKDNQRIIEAARAVYYAAHWAPDRACDAEKLWTELRDACGFEPGNAPQAHGTANK